MLPIKYLYANLRLSLTTMAIVTLLQRHDKGLEALGEDLLRIIKEELTEEIYKTSSLIDYLSLTEQELDYQFSQEQVKEELDWLVEEIKLIKRKYSQELRQCPRAIHFEFPNTIVFELLESRPKIIRRL